MSEDCPVVPVIPLHRLRVYNPARMNDDEITVLLRFARSCCSEFYLMSATS